MKRILILLGCLWSVSAFAANSYLSCGQSAAIGDAKFCPSFKNVAICRCNEILRGQCGNISMSALKGLMIARYGSIQKACEWEEQNEHDTTAKECVDKWNFYDKNCK